MGDVMCDCYVHRVELRHFPIPPASENGRSGEHMCSSCLRQSRCYNHPMNKAKDGLLDGEDLPDLESANG